MIHLRSIKQTVRESQANALRINLPTYFSVGRFDTGRLLSLSGNKLRQSNCATSTPNNRKIRFQRKLKPILHLEAIYLISRIKDLPFWFH